MTLLTLFAQVAGTEKPNRTQEKALGVLRVCGHM